MTVRYPNGKPYVGRPSGDELQTINYANRGMSLEDDLNATNLYYREQDIAVIYKKPTPVQIVRVDYPKRSAAKITEAYFKKPSTTDYNGIYKGRYIDFEAKETMNRTALPLQNFHEHQIRHMQQVKAHGGIVFIIVKFTRDDDVYLLDADVLFQYWKEQARGGRKSLPKLVFEEKGDKIPFGWAPRLDYLAIVDRKYIKN